MPSHLMTFSTLLGMLLPLLRTGVQHQLRPDGVIAVQITKQSVRDVDYIRVRCCLVGAHTIYQEVCSC